MAKIYSKNESKFYQCKQNHVDTKACSESTKSHDPESKNFVWNESKTVDKNNNYLEKVVYKIVFINSRHL